MLHYTKPRHRKRRPQAGHDSLLFLLWLVVLGGGLVVALWGALSSLV